MKNLPSFALVCLMFFSGCHSKNYPASNLPAHQIIFGNGGGFTGEVKQYILLENGQLFQKSSLSEEITELDKIEKRRAASFFEKADNLDQISFDHPGNRYYFISHKSGEKENKVVWGGTGHEVPQYIKELYSSLIDIVKSNN